MVGQLGLFLSSHRRVAPVCAEWCCVYVHGKPAGQAASMCTSVLGCAYVRHGFLVVVHWGSRSCVNGVCMYIGGCACVWCLSMLVGEQYLFMLMCEYNHACVGVYISSFVGVDLWKDIV